MAEAGVPKHPKGILKTIGQQRTLSSRFPSGHSQHLHFLLQEDTAGLYFMQEELYKRVIKTKVSSSSVVSTSSRTAQHSTSIRGSRGPGGRARPGEATPCSTGGSPPCDYSRPVYNSASSYQTPRLSFYTSPPSGGSGQTPRPPRGSHTPCASCAAPGGGAGRGAREKVRRAHPIAPEEPIQLLTGPPVLVLQQGALLQ